MTSNPSVSIILPIYNVERYLARCLDSLLAQTHGNLEIILVNDATPDGAMAIAREYAEKDKRIVIIEHDKNRGPMRARENGYKAATGQYITFCDSDDTMPPTAIETLVRAAEETQSDIVSGDYVHISIQGGKKHCTHRLDYGTDAHAVYQSMLMDKYSHGLCGKIFRHELLQDYVYDNYDNCTNAEDGILFYQVLQNVGRVTHLHQVVYDYWQNAESSTQKRLTEMGTKNILLLLHQHKKILAPYPDLKPLLDRYITGTIIKKYQLGYDKEFDFEAWLKEYDLSEYTQNGFMLRRYGLKKFAELWFKKRLYYPLKLCIRLMRK